MKRYIFIFHLLVLAGFTAVLSRPTSAAKQQPPAASPPWRDIILLSGDAAASTDSTRPIIQAGPNGHDLTVVFTSQMDTDTARNPYYTESLDNGDAWSGMLPIHQSGHDSTNVNFTFDPTGSRHAVWREQLTGASSALLYKPEPSFGIGQAVTITVSSILPGIFDPQIVASQASLLDMVWAQGDGQNPNIFHGRSQDGINWTVKAVATTSPQSIKPALAIDDAGGLHAVWEEGGGGNSVIYYAQGTADVNKNVSWSSPITISNRGNPPVTDGTQPDITTDGQTLYVSFTDRVASNNQRLYQLTCAANCTVLNNWVSANNPISNQPLDVHATDPFDVISTIVQAGRCTYIYYHGSLSGFGNDNEMILGNNSCDGWSTSPADQVTQNNVRSIRPSMAQHNNWFFYIVYEEINTDGFHDVYFQRNNPAVYLPMVLR